MCRKSNLSNFLRNLSIEIFSVHLISKYTNRPAFLIKVSDEYGHEGWGESAPYPEFGTETIAECRAGLSSIIRDIRELQSKNFLLEIGTITNFLDAYQRFPTARHGIEQAILNLWARQQNISLAKLLNPLHSSLLNINGLIDRVSPDQAVQETIALKKSGIDCIKVKVGNENFATSYDRLLAIYSILDSTLGSQIKFRLDPNQSWTVSETIEYVKKLSFLQIDYLEEPIVSNDTGGLQAIKNSTGIAIALDESVRNLEALIKFAEYNCADYLILKPMFCGGILSAYEMGKKAKELGLQVIVTSTLEGWVGWAGATQLAMALNITVPCGLSVISSYDRPKKI